MLIENNLYKRANRILVIDVNKDVQIKRIIKRYKINIKNAKKILKIQTSRKNRIYHANDIINGNEKIYKIKKIVKNLHKLYINLSKINC